ncbi:hypothetical protein pdam_00021002 [Pocillopora damicornis]|uniref:Rap-GAP domain-containing protein n=1 Tax=Pocillopora damicornis TaxID=46731 RepID=A0A3M6V1U2_POCDA|nr:hypothetical protein pdam_00021002 [Pocillopora damicornis]
MSRQNASESFRQKVKQFFGVKKGHAIPSSVYEGPKADDRVFHHELLQDIGKNSPLANRVKYLRDLCDFLINKRVEDFNRLGILRAHFFSVVVNHKIPEDITPRLELLQALSDNGKDISYFEERTGPFLLSWMPEVMQKGRMIFFMPLLINVIHYNSSFLDEDIISGIVRQTCHLSRTTKEEGEVELCLCLLDAVVRYSCLPSNTLFEFIATACRAVNIEKFCQRSWKIMRNLLGTHLGHSGVYTMCNVLEDSDNRSDAMLLRGSVFFIGMCLWGSQRVPNLKYSSSTVLPSMLQALSCHLSLVALEVTLSLQRLVKKYGQELHVVAWDAVLDIIEALQQEIEEISPPDNVLIENLHILLFNVEDLYESGKFNGPEERFFALLEKSAGMLPDRSLQILISYKAQSVHPAHVGWLVNLHDLMEKYFRYEIRTSVRVKALTVLSSVLTSYGHWYEEELLEHAVLPYLIHIPEDQDVTVRNVAVQILLDLCQMSDSQKCQDFLDIIEKVISRHVELQGKSPPLEQQEQMLQEEKELKDVKTAVSGLVEVFKLKLFRLPHGHAVRTFELLVSHVKAHYNHCYSTYIANFDSHILLLCLDFDGTSAYFVLPFHFSDSDTKTSSSSHLALISYSDVFQAILNCLQYEWDWTVLEHVLSGLPEVLQNKSLILSANPALNTMTSVLCNMVSEPSFILDLRRVPPGVGRVGLQALIFPVSFIGSCHIPLQPGQGTAALLVRLTQISATVAMAAPMLEFLSGLVHLPHLYASFQDSQYKSVFAISLPYTDPFKYSQYTITLAYHVIAAWFIRSRVAYRKAFVGFVSKGLKSSAIIPDRYEPKPDSPSLATTKSRTGNSTNQPSPQIHNRSSSPVVHKETETACELHAEMSEVCMDMMARYTFAPCMSQPNRTKAVELMLANGHSRTWMIGNTIVTITTSGTYIGQDGNCDNCLALRQRTVNMSPKESAKTERNVKQKITAVDVTTEDSHIQSPDEKGHGTFTSHGTGTQTPAGADESSKPEVKSEFHSGALSDRRLSGQFVAINPQNCRCVCQGWAEIFIRRPSGNISWIMRIQNRATSWLESDVSTALIDDPQIDEFSSPPCEMRGEVLSTSTESGSVIIDVVRQSNPPEGVGAAFHDTARGESLARSGWQHGSTDGDKDADVPQLNSVLIYSQSASTATPPSTPAGSVDSELFEGRERLLSRSPSKGPHVFTMRESECSDILGSLERTPNEDVPPNKTRKFDKPELGVSPVDPFPVSSLPRHNQLERKRRDETKYLSSSEMYRLASDEKSVQSLNIEENEDHSGNQKMETVQGDVPQGRTINPAKKAERKKSVPYQSLEEEHGVIRESPEFALDTVFSKTDTKSAPTTSFDSGVSRYHQDLSRFPQPKQHGDKLDTSDQVPRKVKLRKSSSFSSPTMARKALDHSEHSPYASPRQGRISIAVKSKEAEDRLFSPASVGDPKKSTSSPELSSPPAFPKVLNSETSKRPTSRSRMMPHAMGPQLTNKSSKSAPTVGDSSDGGPKEPPILVTPSESFRYPLDPCFVFLQLYHASFLGLVNERPQPLPDGEVIERAIKCLDRIPPYDTHKIGVIYVGPGQHDNEAAILSNVYGSSRYMQFLAGLGTLVRLRDCPPAEIYTGGLDRNGADGEFAYSWQDDICQVIFHVATLMPTRDSDPGCNSKKMHIGNDFVTIVYNDSQQAVKFGRIKGQFNFAEVLIKPLDNASNMVTVRFKDELKELLSDTGTRVISDNNLPRLVRQLVVHINMASVIHQSQKRPTDAYGCNWLERLRQIKRVHSKAAAENSSVPSSPTVRRVSPSAGLRMSSAPISGLTDFTEYIIK